VETGLVFDRAVLTLATRSIRRLHREAPRVLWRCCRRSGVTSDKDGDRGVLDDEATTAHETHRHVRRLTCRAR
jgi:hypothetical protein